MVMPLPDFETMILENLRVSIELHYQNPEDDYPDEDEAEEDGEELYSSH